MYNWFLNLSTRAKLTVTFGIGVLSLISVIVVSVLMMMSLRDEQLMLKDITISNVVDYKSLETNINSNRVALLRMMRTRDRGIQEALEREIKDVGAESDEIMKRLFARVERDPIPSEKLRELDKVRKEFNKIRDEVMIPEIRRGVTGDLEKAFELNSELYSKVKLLSSELSDIASKEAELAVRRTVKLVNKAIYILGIIGVSVFLISLFMIPFINSTIAGPLNQITQSASRIATGDLEVEMVQQLRHDEIGMLWQSFKDMSDSLKGMSRLAEQIADGDLTVTVNPRSKKDVLGYSFGLMAENMRGLVREIKEGVTELNESTIEIIAATKDVYTDVGETEASTNLQKATQRLEALGDRLNLVVSQIKT